MAKEKEKMDMQAMMEVYKKLGTPGDTHKLLAKLEGSWTTKTIGYQDGKPVHGESTGGSDKRLMLGGRYLWEEYSGDMMGAPYNGISILGYNNHTKNFESIWVDSMSTAIYLFVGKMGADNRTITQECSFDDAVRGPCVWRTVTRIRDDNTLEFEMFIKPKGGKEEKMMEMTSIRTADTVRKAA